VQLADLVHEGRLRGAHIEERLARLRIGEKDHEVHRVARAQGHADLRVVLEAADPGAVAGTRIDDDVRSPFWVQLDIRRGEHPQERIVDRMLEAPPVHHGLVLKVQERWMAGALVLEIIVAAAAQRVPEEHRAFCGVERVLGPRLPDVDRGGRRPWPGRKFARDAHEPRAVTLVRGPQSIGKDLGDLGRDMAHAGQRCDRFVEFLIDGGH
jgi:hypothetical protein